jgi:catechol 2,3-dioxygenase-like lactoylglutathione lyase family enzyme
MKLLHGCLATLLLSASRAAAQGQPPAADVPSFTAQGAFVAMVVADLDASVHWYESNLGLHLVKRGKSTRVPAETVVMGGHNLFVELIHHEGKALPTIGLAPFVGQELRITGIDYNGPIHVDKAEVKKDGKWAEIDIKYHEVKPS